MSSVLGDIDFTDAACKNDKASRQYCSDPWGSDIPACASSTLTVNATGIRRLGYYDAQMIIEIVSRRCGSLSSGQTDHCTPISHLNEIQSQTVNVGAFDRLTRRFDSVTYQGQECYTVEPKTKPPPTTRRITSTYRTTTTPLTNGGQRPTLPFTVVLTLLHLLVLIYSWCC
ncbi:uncharacterized protein LOC128202876 isoform X2 [Mya arenaria]|nr:uncharacterized protein LOC128202876 isoform X2 [Mya arenaria]